MSWSPSFVLDLPLGVGRDANPVHYEKFFIAWHVGLHVKFSSNQTSLSLRPSSVK